MEFDPKTLKKPRYFWNFIINSKKTLGFSRFSTNIPKKPRVFFWNSSKFQKNLGFSKIPKIFGEIDEFLGILENSMFFLNFEEFQKYPRFFWNLIQKPLKKTRYFWNYFFKLFYQNSEKT